MVTKYKFTVDDLFAIDGAETGLPRKRVELLDGEIFVTSLPSSRQSGRVMWLNKALQGACKESASISVRHPLILNEHCLLKPDLALLSPKDNFYMDAHPTAKDTLLAIEVSLSSLAFDKEKKLPAYAEAGVPELWIVDVERGRTEVYYEPLRNNYRHRSLVPRGEEVAPRAFPEIEIAVFPPL